MLKLGEHLRLHPLVRGAHEPYRYEREVEEFLRWSPHVRGSLASQRAQPPLPRRAPATSPVQHYDELEAEEVIALLGSLEPTDLVSAARARAHPRRPRGRARGDRVGAGAQRKGAV